MTTQIVIPGLSSTTRRPGFFAETKYAASPPSAGDIPLTLLLVGNKTSAGSMTADGTPQLVVSGDDVDLLAGPGSELATLAYGVDGLGGAFATPGVAIWLAAVAEATSGPVAATATVTITGTWTASGTLKYRLSGAILTVGVLATDSVTDVAVSIKNAINSNTKLPFTANNASGVLTITSKNLGVRNNWHSIFQDVTAAPTGLVSTITAGSSMTGGGKHFTGGAGSDTPANIIAAISSTQYDRIAIACGDPTLDAVHLALWKLNLGSQAGAQVGILEHLITAAGDSLTNAAALSVTTLNDARFQVLHLLNSETHPSAIAGAFGAMRCSAEQQFPAASYDDAVVPGVAPQSQTADRPSPTTIETALAEGVTEMYTSPDGTARITRSIVTRCRNGSTPDYRIFDSSEAIVPDFVRFALKLLYLQLKEQNPSADDNPPEELRSVLSGVLTPDNWNSSVFQLMKELERGVGIPSGFSILSNVDGHPPVSQWDSAAKRIVSIVPTVPRPGNHQLGVSVRQLNG